MGVFRQTESGDLYRPAGARTFERVEGVQRGIQHMRSRLRTFRREVITDERLGMAFFELVADPRTDTNAIANHLASIALGTPGITDVNLSFTFEDVRAILDVDAEAVFNDVDQRERIPFHERIQITRGGGSQPV
jgi:hypothetical protein